MAFICISISNINRVLPLFGLTGQRKIAQIQRLFALYADALLNSYVPRALYDTPQNTAQLFRVGPVPAAHRFEPLSLEFSVLCRSSPLSSRTASWAYPSADAYILHAACFRPGLSVDFMQYTTTASFVCVYECIYVYLGYGGHSIDR